MASDRLMDAPYSVKVDPTRGIVLHVHDDVERKLATAVLSRDEAKHLCNRIGELCTRWLE